jgi:hypothetical protein
LNNNQINKLIAKKAEDFDNYNSNKGKIFENPLLERRPVKNDIVNNMMDS